MARISVYQEETNRTYSVTAEALASVMDMVEGSASDGDIDYYIRISTNIPKVDGTSWPVYIIRKLTDNPPGVEYSTPSTFTELINQYVTYFITVSQLTESSSSSSSFSSSSSSSVSSSSSSMSSDSSSSWSSSSSSSSESSSSS